MEPSFRTGESYPLRAGYELPAIATVAAITSIATSAAPPRGAPPPPAVPAGPPTAPTAALGLRPCFIHHEVSPAEVLPVQRINRAIRVFVAADLNEGEPARLPGKTIADQIDARG